MCYSAQIEADWRRYRRQYGVEVSLSDFYDLFYRRAREGHKIKVPKALEVAFADAQSEQERGIAALIAEYNEAEATRLEQELFKQRKRLADAERSLHAKPTKTAGEHRRIATEKTEWILGKLASLKSLDLTLEDQRIFPGHYAPVIVMEDGRRVVKPMRYQCRLAGKPAFYDTKFPGTYNARRDSLGGFWKEQFGATHGIMIANAFFENVSRHRLEGRELAPGEKEENVILEFRPRPTQDMLIACLWSKWQAPGEAELLSFAAITDEPPAEVAAAGHDRCIIPIKAENVEAWLSPASSNLPAMQAILDDRERPYYEHRMAA